VGKTAAKTRNMCGTYSNYALSQMMTYEWSKHFKNGRTSADNDEWSSRHSTSRSEPLIAQVKNIIHENHQLTV
jgi:hypothetical protein